MPPATNRKLTNASTMEEALAAMQKGAKFVFNGRSQPLTVVEESSTKMVAKSNRGTVHRFVWGVDYNYPKHKPRKNQTNNIKELTVVEYSGSNDSGSLSEPIKINWTGDARSKLETRYYEPAIADGEIPASSREVLSRQKSNVVIKNTSELQTFAQALRSMIETRSSEWTTWMTAAHERAYERVYDDLSQEAEKRNINIATEAA